MKTAEMTEGEELAIKGICPLCGNATKKWTAEEIENCKEDICLDESEDFCAMCDQCFYEAYPQAALMFDELDRAAAGRLA